MFSSRFERIKRALEVAYPILDDERKEELLTNLIDIAKEEKIENFELKCKRYDELDSVVDAIYRFSLPSSSVEAASQEQIYLSKEIPIKKEKCSRYILRSKNQETLVGINFEFSEYDGNSVDRTLNLETQDGEKFLIYEELKYNDGILFSFQIEDANIYEAISHLNTSVEKNMFIDSQRLIKETSFLQAVVQSKQEGKVKQL